MTPVTILSLERVPLTPCILRDNWWLGSPTPRTVTSRSIMSYLSLGSAPPLLPAAFQAGDGPAG